MLTTTFRELRKNHACEERYKYLRRALKGRKDTEEIALLEILGANGLDDALWALRACGDERFARLLAGDFAWHVLPIYEREYQDDKRVRRAIRVARRFANGRATIGQLAAAGDAAWAAARDAARDAAGGAARDAAWAAWAAAGGAAWDAARDAAWNAAWAARAAARGAAWDAERTWQEAHLRKMLVRGYK